VIETPIVLTATLATFLAADALITYMHALPGNEEMGTVNPVVAETNDGFLSDMRRRPVTQEHVLAALRGATAGPVAEGAVGAGTGTAALGYKAGIGTASRIAECGDRTVTLGVLTQANFGGTLTVRGVPVPARAVLAAAGLSVPDQEAADQQASDQQGAGQQPADDGAGRQGNSCVIVLATDAPLDARQLTRIARRAIFSMARTGSAFEGSSGDYALAFSVAAHDGTQGRLLPDADLDPLFVAAMDSTEEAILNSLFMAETTTGFRQRVRYAVPLRAVPSAR
jgi:D-aminopeptidase